MITPQYLAQSFAGNLNILDRQLDGLSHEDSLLQLPFRGNCLNWVLGHLLEARGRMMKGLLDLPTVIQPEELAIYGFGRDPITEDGEAVIKMERLVKQLHATQDPINERMGSMDLEEFNMVSDFDIPLSQNLMFFYFHETYHIGQTELLRQLAGVNDKVI